MGGSDLLCVHSGGPWQEPRWIHQPRFEPPIPPGEGGRWVPSPSCHTSGRVSTVTVSTSRS